MAVDQNEQRSRREAYVVVVKPMYHCVCRVEPKTLHKRLVNGSIRHVHGTSTPTRWAYNAYITFSRARRWAARTHREYVRSDARVSLPSPQTKEQDT